MTDEDEPRPASTAILIARGRRSRRLARLLHVLLLAAGIGHLALAIATRAETGLHAGLDHVLLTSPAIAERQAVRAWLTVVVVAMTLVGVAVGVAWFRAARARLETLVGASLGPRGRRPGRWSPRRWRPLVAPVGPDRDVWWATQRVSSSRLLAGAAAVAAAIGVTTFLAGVALAWLAPSAALGRAGLELAIAGSAVCSVAAILAAALVQAVRRREAVALRNVVQPRVTTPQWFPPAPALIAAGAVLAVGLAVAGDATPADCDLDGLDCVELVVPVDRDPLDPRGETMTVRFGIHRGADADGRTLVVAVGGPGSSGLDQAASRIATFDSEVLDAFDVVFFDQRGVGDSDGRDCEAASSAHALADATDVEAASRFVRQCLREARVEGDDVERYATRQVVGDLEALRVHLGVERLALYGESYGTKLIAAYADAHPDRVEALVLDAPVDIALGPDEFWAAAAAGFRETLEQSFTECRADLQCRRVLPDPGAAYARLDARLRGGPLDVRYVDLVGEEIDDRVSLQAFERATAGLLYTPTGRMIALRILADVERGDETGLGRLAGANGTAVGDPTFSEFLYWAVTCADERFSPTDRDDDAPAYLARAAELGMDRSVMGSIFYVGLPCLHWPSQVPSGSHPRPTLAGAPYPVLVVTSTGDPITRAASAKALAARLPDAWLVQTSGGPHVTYASGYPCVDRYVREFLVDGVRPFHREVGCPGDAMDPFIGLTALDADEFPDGLEAMSALADELFAAPELWFWQGLEPLGFGCRFGGTVIVEFNGLWYDTYLDRCEFARGLAVDGVGTMDPFSGALELDAEVGGDAVTFSLGEDGSRSLVGVWNGDRVDLSD